MTPCILLIAILIHTLNCKNFLKIFRMTLKESIWFKEKLYALLLLEIIVILSLLVILTMENKKKELF